MHHKIEVIVIFRERQPMLRLTRMIQAVTAGGNQFRDPSKFINQTTAKYLNLGCHSSVIKMSESHSFGCQ